MRLSHMVRKSLLSQITLAILVLVLATLVEGVFNVMQLRDIDEAITQTVQNSASLVERVHQMHNAFLTFDDQANMWVGLRPFGLQSPYAKSTLAQAQAAERQLNLELKGLLRLPLPSPEKALLLALSQRVRAYDAFWSETERFAHTDPPRAAEIMYVGNHQVTSEARKEFARLNALLGAQAQGAVRAAQHSTDSVLTALAAEALLVLLLGALVVVAVRRALAPVPHLTRTLEAMAQGQFDAQPQITPHSDEISRLVHTTAALGQRLRQARAAREAHQRELERLVQFNALLADVSRMAAQAPDDRALLQDACDLAVRRAGFGLVWVGAPDATGQVRFLASAGATGYLEDLEVSVQPDDPVGQGPTGEAWRSGVAQYVASVAEHPQTGPWRERAGRFGLTGIVVIPCTRGGLPFGVWSFYLTGGQEFGPDVRLLLEEMARTASSGLDRLDASTREQELATVQRLLLDQTAAGISMGRNRVLIVANRHLVEMLGYDGAEDLVGQSARMLYASDAEFDRVGEVYRSLPEKGVGSLSNVRLVRRDGRELVGDITMSLTRSQGLDTVIWTVHDVTERFELEKQLEAQALHDALTLLPNKRALDLELGRALERARRRGRALFIGIFDLDDFKTVNGTLGHEAGDLALKEFARRLREQVRSSEFVARLGGDEFVILLEDFELPFAEEPLRAALRRLHAIVEEPLEPVPGHRFTLEMSLGLAAFPDDGKDGDDLLRQADQALFHLKAHKHDRAQWWQLASQRNDAEPELETHVDAYDSEAATLLAGAGDIFRDVAREFAASFHLQASSDGEAASVLASLSRTSVDLHRQLQGEHMVQLFGPSTTREALLARASRLGERHSLVGVDAALLSRSIALYRELLAERLNQTLMSARERYRILLLAERRLQDNLEGELQAMQRVTAAYLDLVATPLPDIRTLWVDSLTTELSALGRLPGIAAVVLLRLNADGFLTVEHSAGEASDEAERLLQGFEAQQQLIRDVGERPGSTVAAWRDGQILSVPNFQDDPRFASWWGLAGELGARSMLAIPVLDASGHMVAGLCAFGRYPNQFESQVMRQFSQSVGLRWEELWRRSALPPDQGAIPHAVARVYRDRLFKGGLSMFVQPIVDLRDGQLVKVEALARLMLPDGRTVSPGEFLPLLGDAELARLFRQGLDQALGYLPIWQAAGIRIGISVNLPPSTLLVPECDRWVAEALARHDVAPERLTLELLETTQIDEALRDTGIARLSRLGVQLAMDDLGAGYSSLMRLSALPFHTIKIDQGLLRRLRDEPQLTLAVIDTLIEMGRRLEREVVVEGLEDEGVIEVAALLGATFGQGYGLGLPMPPADLPKWRERFSLPIEPGAAHTYLGAMAHHWKYGHALPLADCPMTAFLAEQGLEASDAAVWHAQAHASEAGSASSGALMAWFLERMRVEHARDR